MCCRPGAAWDLRRCFVFHPPNSLPPGAVAPHPSSFSYVCVVLCRCGVSVCFSFGFSWWVRADLVNGVGLCGRLLGWGECVRAVGLFLVDFSTGEGWTVGVFS